MKVTNYGSGFGLYGSLLAIECGGQSWPINP